MGKRRLEESRGERHKGDSRNIHPAGDLSFIFPTGIGFREDKMRLARTYLDRLNPEEEYVEAAVEGKANKVE